MIRSVLSRPLPRGGWLCLLWLLLLSPPTRGQAPTIQWQQVLGTNSHDIVQRVQPTLDGGYVFGGWTPEGSWLVKLSAQGQVQWSRTLENKALDNLHDLQQTRDGGYILGGTTSLDIPSSRGGGLDYWVVKLTAQGEPEWERIVGGTGHDDLSAVRQTPDGGYLLAGSSSSPVSGDKTQFSNLWGDYWVVKLDARGLKQWDRTYGGSDNERLYALQLTPDGGYVLGGDSRSGVSGNKTQPPRDVDASGDGWLVKVDAQGTKQWDRTLGGAGNDYIVALQLTPEGGYAVGCRSNSGPSPDKSQSSRGLWDYWVLQLDAQGRRQWDRTVGGVREETLYDLQLTPDGGYLLAGNSESGATGEKSEASRGAVDAWLVKLSATGEKQWDRTLGGLGLDYLCSARPTPDGGYILGAHSDSGPSADKPQPSLGGSDAWILKLGPAPVPSPALPPVPVPAPSPVAPPVVLIRGDSVVCPGGQGALRAAAAGALSYQWNEGTTGATLPLTQPGLYTVTATFASGQTSQAQWRVAAGECLFIPSIITPNGDAYNERFVVKGLAAGPWSLAVYSRWGQCVYSTRSYQQDWGEQAAPGVYYYELRHTSGATRYTGWVEVRP